MKKLFKQHDRKNVYRIIFLNEKLFYTEQCYKTKNDAVYSAIFENIPEIL